MVLSSCLISGSTGVGTRCGAGSNIRTGGSAETRGRDLAIAWHCRTVSRSRLARTGAGPVKAGRVFATTL
jgi:hypothetical protein